MQELCAIHVDWVKRQTLKAYLCVIAGREIWLPKSQMVDTLFVGQRNVDTWVPCWLAENNGLFDPSAVVEIDDGIVSKWYREMAMKFHPDRGGHHEAMVAINFAYERLKEMLTKT